MRHAVHYKLQLVEKGFLTIQIFLTVFLLAMVKFYSNYLKKFIKSVLFLRFCIHLLSVKIKIQYAIQIEINKKINIEIINLLIAFVSNFTYDCREF